MRNWNSRKWLLLAALTVVAPACGDDTTNPAPTGGGTGAGSGTGGEGGGTGTGGGGGGTGGSTAAEWPTLESEIAQDPAIEMAVAELVDQMTVAQKVGQITQAEIQSITPAEVYEYHIGSVLNGGGSWPGADKNSGVADWVALADEFYNASVDTSNGHLGIPVIWGTDAVHGHSNVRGATTFPHNIALGAAHDPELIEQIGAITALQVAATGLDWSFSPTLAVVRDDRWGRSYEGYSEDPEIVKEYASRMIHGLQGAAADPATLLDQTRVIATAKHFLGDGGTTLGDDQGNTEITEEELRDIHAQGYLSAIPAGVQTVMASYNSWNGQKMHGNKYLLTDILKTKLGFDGFVVGDWNGHGQVPGCDNKSCAAAINAGVDMIMVPQDWKEFIENTIAQVDSGEIPMERLNDAVTRILRVKMRLGLLGPSTTKGAPSTRALASSDISAPEIREVARQAVRESLVLLKNKGGVLPLGKDANILVAGKSADNLSNQNGGWTLTWQGTENTNADFPNAQSIYAGITEVVTASGGDATLSPTGAAASEVFDAAIVVIGETPYAEMMGDIEPTETLEHALLNPEDLAVLETIRTQAPTLPIITVFLSGRPLYVNRELNRSDAFVAGWLPGSEGGGIADVLFGDAEFQGKLSFSWPAEDCQTSLNRNDENVALFPYGFGLTTADEDTLGDLPEASTAGGCNP